MQRLFTVLAMLAILGSGILLGSALTPSARAQAPKPVALNDSNAPAGGIDVIPPSPMPMTSPYYPYYPYYQWQIYPMQVPNAATMLFLLNAQTGNTFYLKEDKATNSYFWAAIPRG